MKRILIKPFAWHLTMLIIGVLAAPSSALGWSILATASPFRLRVRHLIAILAVVLLLSFVPVLLTRGTVRRILYGLPLLLLPGMLLSVFRRADGMRFMGEPVMLAVTGGILLLVALIPFLIGLIRGRKTRVRARHGGAHARGRAAMATTSDDGYGWARRSIPAGPNHNHRRVSRRSSARPSGRPAPGRWPPAARAAAGRALQAPVRVRAARAPASSERFRP